MVSVPEKFRPRIKVDYPEGNKPIFEEWFREQTRITKSGSAEYLPMFWTSYFVNNAYGKNLRAKKELQQFIHSLDRTKKYFTIIQYDDGPLVDLPANIKVFAMSGPRIDYPLPLICQPHKYNFNIDRDLLCNFVGRLTHPIRKQMVSELSGKAGYFISTNAIPTDQYCRLLASSVFTLCPRGYGQTSFRICEALQYGSIPVYISDEFIIPHNEDFNEYGVLINAKDVSRIPEILSVIPESEIKRKQENGNKIYNEKFSFQGCKDLILSNI
jgi:hypothetical protein